MANKRILAIVLVCAIVAAVSGGALLTKYFTAPAHAQGYNVDSFVDAVDALPGDGRCATIAGDCTLRAAIQEANTQPFPSTIVLTWGTYALTIDGFDDTAAAGDLDIRQQMVIEGAGSTITSNEFDHLIEVHDAQATISDATLQSAASVGIVGGAIQNSNAGRLTLDGVTIQMSSAMQHGGAIYNDGGTVTLRDSTLLSNDAPAGGWSNLQ
jgi:CSLREA domain-containing protein